MGSCYSGDHIALIHVYTDVTSNIETYSELQIREGIKDNSKIVFISQ